MIIYNHYIYNDSSYIVGIKKINKRATNVQIKQN